MGAALGAAQDGPRRPPARQAARGRHGRLLGDPGAGYGIIHPPTRKDIKVYRIDAMDAANEMNNAKAFNMIVLGGLLKIRPVVTIANVLKGHPARGIGGRSPA